MADIKDRIKKLDGYFQEMQIVPTKDGTQAIYVRIQFPSKWIVDSDINKKFKVTVANGTNMGEFYFCTDIETGETELFDAIDYSIDKMKSAIERANLLREKTIELKNIFENESISLEKLRSLKFDYEQKDLITCAISKGPLEDSMRIEDMELTNTVTSLDLRNGESKKKLTKEEEKSGFRNNNEECKNVAL